MKKKSLLVSFLLLLSAHVFSQNNNIPEKSIFGIQAGFHSLDIYNEYQLHDEMYIRSSFYLPASLHSGNEKTIVLRPAFSVTPKWYYNLNERSDKNISVKNNSANYISLEFNYISDFFYISNKEFSSLSTFFQVIPKWGLRRNINQSINYEINLGMGIERNISREKNNAIIDLSLKLGYNF